MSRVERVLRWLERLGAREQLRRDIACLHKGHKDVVRGQCQRYGRMTNS